MGGKIGGKNGQIAFKLAAGMLASLDGRTTQARSNQCRQKAKPQLK
jgi:hypothetical protein